MVRHRAPTLVAVTLALVGGLVFPPVVAAAGAFHGTAGGHHAVGGGRGFSARPFVHHPGSRFPARPFVHHHPFFHHRHPFFGGFGSFGEFASPVVYVAPSWSCSDPYGYGSPCDSYDPYTYYRPPVTYASMASPGPGAVSAISLAPAPPPAPTQPPRPNVVEFPSGRYELRGDGMTVPYTWVWIPNPPSAPPSAGTPRVSRHELYRWTDEEGVLHATDRLEVVPPKYRSQAKQAPPL
jgi:hypothetical protein